MEKAHVLSKYKKILKHINKKYNLNFEEILYYNAFYLVGIKAERAIWMYMQNAQLIIEESEFFKGERYKRIPAMENFELNQEKYKQIEEQVDAYLKDIEVRDLEFKMKRMFDPNNQTGKNFLNGNLMKLIDFARILKGQEQCGGNDSIWMKEVEGLMKGTKYETIDKLVPLTLGLERHRFYDVGRMTREKVSHRVSVLKTASKKVLFLSKEMGTFEVFESEKEFVQAFEKDREKYST